VVIQLLYFDGCRTLIDDRGTALVGNDSAGRLISAIHKFCHKIAAVQKRTYFAALQKRLHVSISLRVNWCLAFWFINDKMTMVMVQYRACSFWIEISLHHGFRTLDMYIHIYMYCQEIYTVIHFDVRKTVWVCRHPWYRTLFCERSSSVRMCVCLFSKKKKDDTFSFR